MQVGKLYLDVIWVKLIWLDVTLWRWKCLRKFVFFIWIFFVSLCYYSFTPCVCSLLSLRGNSAFMLVFRYFVHPCQFHLIRSKSSSSSSLYVFIFTPWGSHILILIWNVPGFYQTHLSHFPRCPKAALRWPPSFSKWLFPYITLPKLHHILLPLWLASTKNSDSFLLRQSFRGHCDVLDMRRPPSHVWLVIFVI